MVKSVEELVKDAQLIQNKEMINELSKDQNLNVNVRQSLEMVNSSIDSNDLKVTKIDQGKGEYSNHIDIETTSDKGVSSISLNEKDWQVKGIENNFSGSMENKADLYLALEENNSIKNQINKSAVEIDNKSELNQDTYLNTFTNTELGKAVIDRVGGQEAFINAAENRTPDQYMQDFSFDKNRDFYIENKAAFDQVLDNATIGGDYHHKGYAVLYAANGVVDRMESDWQIKTEADRINEVLDTSKGLDDPRNAYVLDTINKMGYIELVNEHKAYELSVDRDVMDYQNEVKQNEFGLYSELSSQEVFQEASKNFHQNSINELKSIVNDLENQGALVTGKYDPEKLQIDLNVRDNETANKDVLFSIETTKMSNEILVSGKHTNEDFIYSFKEPMESMDKQLIVDQFKVEQHEASINKELENSNQSRNIEIQDLPEIKPASGFDPELSIKEMNDKYYSELERMGAVNDFENSGSNNALKTYEQLNNIAQKNGMEVEYSQGQYADSLRADFTKDGEKTNISAELYLDGKAAISYDNSMYILSNKPNDIDYEVSRLVNEVETDRHFNSIEYIDREMQQDSYIPDSNVDYSQYSQDYSYTQETINLSQPVSAEQVIPDPNLDARTPDTVVANDTPLKDTSVQVETTSITTDRPIESNTRVDSPEHSSSANATVDKTGYSIPQSVAMDYVHTPSDSSFKSSKFYEKNNPLSVAFEDRGKALSSGRDDAKTIQSMVAIAKQKNWGNIQIKGSEEFKRQAWIEAQAHGIQVRGYSPTERDKVALQVRQEELSKNQIQHVPERVQSPKTEVTKTTEVKHQTVVDHREDLEAKRIASRKVLEFMIKDKPNDEKTRILGEFDKKAADPKQLEKLAAPIIKQAKEMEHNASSNKERSR